MHQTVYQVRHLSLYDELQVPRRAELEAVPSFEITKRHSLSSRYTSQVYRHTCDTFVILNVDASVGDVQLPAKNIML